MAINRKQIKRLLDEHRFEDLFIEELGWDEYTTSISVEINGSSFELKPIAQKRGFVALLYPAVPDSSLRAKIETKVSKNIREHLIIFLDSETKAQRWQWVRRVSGQPLSRKEHEYLPHQPMLLIEKIGYLEVGMDEEENIDLIDVFEKVHSAFNIDKVTKKFYDRFKKEHDAFLGFINGITELGDQNWYASVMLNRLMFIYFIQKKGFLDGDRDYLRNRLARVQETKGEGKFHTFYRYFMLKLCHEVLAKKERELDKELAALIGKVPYLNGGIFQPHELEIEYGDSIDIPDEAFTKIFDFFDQYEWHLDNRPTAQANEINPDVLGYIFEKYINQKQMGAYYTKEDITEYISKNTIIPCLFDKAKKSCKIAFEGDASVWNLLVEDPDRYIYPAVRHGMTYDIHNDCEIDTPIPYPEEIAIGLDTSKPNLLERRKKWNTRTPTEAGLPTEIWRETIARRQRYEEVKGKLERGEVRSINDLITYNLDIRQFAQDVIERCESPDLLNAFWVALAGYIPTSGKNKKAVAGITVLDPTCGSGAFLFAALNILEPLYEACLERMKGFLEEWSEHPQHKNYTGFFQSILVDIERHPSPKYFIYKSIIIHNLYGVDIMKEAVEICKLRLFLKLVAQVDDGAKIEPLPDIDFNIRAGNTLVGYATEKDVRTVMKEFGGGQLRLLDEDQLGSYQRFENEAQETFRLYQLFREAQLENDKNLTKAKKALSAKLEKLGEQLNIHLAEEYEMGLSRKSKKYIQWKESHQPFHWFIEFYGIMKSGGFDTIIGNPPYVQYSKVKSEYTLNGYSHINCNNLYGYCIERAIILLKTKSQFSYIVPISLVGNQRFEKLNLAMRSLGTVWVASFSGDTHPGTLFSGVQQNLAIFILTKGDSHITYTTNFIRFYDSCDDRACLFNSKISYVKFEGIQKRLPKLGTQFELSIYCKITKQTLIEKEVAPKTEWMIYYHDVVHYWIKSFLNPPYFKRSGENQSISSHYKRFYFFSEDKMKITNMIFLSSLCYFWYLSRGNGRDIAKEDLTSLSYNYKIPISKKTKILKLADQVFQSFEEKKKRVVYRKKNTIVEYDQYWIDKSKSVLDEIDKVLAEHYGFTEEELDYIINYDIKYRMGKDLLEERE